VRTERGALLENLKRRGKGEDTKEGDKGAKDHKKSGARCNRTVSQKKAQLDGRAGSERWGGRGWPEEEKGSKFAGDPVRKWQKRKDFMENPYSGGGGGWWGTAPLELLRTGGNCVQDRGERRERGERIQGSLTVEKRKSRKKIANLGRKGKRPDRRELLFSGLTGEGLKRNVKEGDPRGGEEEAPQIKSGGER